MDEPVAHAKRGRRRILSALGWTVAVGLTVWVGHSAWRSSSEVDFDALDLEALSIAVAICSAAYILRALTWWWITRQMNPRTPLAMASVFLVGQIARYIPGKIWQIIASMALSKDHSVDSLTAGASTTLVLVYYQCTGLLITLLLAAHVWAPNLRIPAALLLLVGLIGLPSLFELFGRFLERYGVNQAQALAESFAKLRTGDIGLLIGSMIAVWALLGTSFYFTILGFGLELGWIQGALGAIAGLIAGFFSLIAPAGMGVREVTIKEFIELEGIPTALAATVSLVFRLVMTVAEFAVFGLGFVIHMLTRRPPAESGTDENDGSTG